MTPSEAISPCVACLSQADKLAIIAAAGLAYLENPGGGGGGGSSLGTTNWYGPYVVNYSDLGGGITTIALNLQDQSVGGILEDIFVQTINGFSSYLGVRGFNLSTAYVDATVASAVVASFRDSDCKSSLAPWMPAKIDPSFQLQFDTDGAELTSGQCHIYAKYTSPPFGTIIPD